jgi:acetyl-CoA hydrolase
MGRLRVEDFVRPHDVVVWGQGPGEPSHLIRALANCGNSVRPLRCFIGLPSSTPLSSSSAVGMGLVSYCGAGTNSRLHAAGVLDILPCHYSDIPRILSRGPLKADIVLLQVPPPGPDGSYGYGVACEYLPAAVGAARHVLVEVNPQLPDILGGPRLSPDAVTVMGEFPRTLPSAPARAHDETESAIVEHVLGLVPDGATLQLGLGSLPARVAAGLRGHRRLGIHSGVIGDEVVDLMLAGAVTNECKELDRGQTVAGLFVGSQRAAAFVNRNPRVKLHRTEYTHNRGVLGSLPAFTAINSAVEVDLTGQVNAESVAGRYVGAVGGAVDFVRGAHDSSGGTSIVALPATAGQRSRIVRRLSGPVSTARSDTGIVVTEHGVADLRGLSVDQRMKAMCAIASPEHSEHLESHRDTADTASP